MNDGISKNKTILLSFLLACLGMVFALFADKSSVNYLVQSVDNYGISIAANAVDVKYNYVSFLSPLLCMFIGVVSNILTSADVFKLFCDVLCFVSLWYMAAFILYRKKDISAKVGAFSIWFVAVCSNICNENFNIITAFVSMAAFLPLMDAIGKKNIGKKHIIISVILFFCASMMRFEIVLLFIPFVALRLFFAYIKSRDKSLVKNAALVFMPVAVCAVFVYACGYFYSHSSAVRPMVEYNAARALVMDYPINVSAVSEESIAKNITENDLRMLNQFMILDTDRIDTDFFNTVADTASVTFYFDNIKNVTDNLKNPSAQCLWIGMAALAVLFLSLLICGDKMQKAEAIFAMLGMTAIVVGFLFRGRITDSVLMSIEYVCACGLITIFDISPSKRIKGVLLAAFAAVFVLAEAKFYTAYYGRPSAPVFTARANDGVIDDIFAPTYEDGKVYIWSATEYSYRLMPVVQGFGKLPTKQFSAHHISAGGWEYGSAEQKARFERAGITNPAYDLLYRPNTYFVGDENAQAIVYQYLLEHIDPTAQVEYAGDLIGAKTWHFTAGKKKK